MHNNPSLCEDKETNIDILMDISIVIQRLNNTNKKIWVKRKSQTIKKSENNHFIHRVLNCNA